MGFIPDVEKIVGLLPPLRQTLFFSATMAPDVRRLADKFLSNPKTVSVAPPASTGATIVQALAMVPSDDWQKREALRRLLRAEPVRNALIFCNRKRDVDVLYKSLKKHGFNAGALHGDMDQSTRTETLDAFKRNEITLLVCSDVAARGLDIDDMSHVFNFDVPIHAEDYVHRIGRTGRAGRTGHAFTLGTRDDSKFIAAIEHLIGKPIPRMTIDGMAADAAPAEGEGYDKRGRGGRRHQRGGRDHRGGRGERGGRPQREHSEPVAAPPVEHEPQRPAAVVPVAPLPAPDKRREQPQQPRGRGRDHERDDGPSPVGMGDHVPAFLLRGRRAVG
jgi:superfamily II DNA/RNA helicase